MITLLTRRPPSADSRVVRRICILVCRPRGDDSAVHGRDVRNTDGFGFFSPRYGLVLCCTGTLGGPSEKVILIFFFDDFGFVRKTVSGVDVFRGYVVIRCQTGRRCQTAA